MTMNDIAELQNTPHFLRLLRARSEIYRRATHLQLVQVTLTVVVPVVMAIVALFMPAIRPAAAAVSVSLTLIDIGFLDRALKRRLNRRLSPRRIGDGPRVMQSSSIGIRLLLDGRHCI